MKKEDLFSVSVFIAVTNLTGKALKQALSVASIRFVEEIDKADLVIFDDLRQVEKDFNKDKSYAFLSTPGRKDPPNLPGNIHLVPVLRAVAEILKIIGDLRQVLPAGKVVEQESEEVLPLRSDALRILVIDDIPRNILSAKKSLAGHILQTATGYEQAMEILAREKFDIVLSDLHLPMSSRSLGDSTFKLGELVPYGLLLMIEAARQGAKRVAVVTDLSHHNDPFSAAFDHFSNFKIKIEEAEVMMLHARLNEDGKDWAEALDRLTA